MSGARDLLERLVSSARRYRNVFANGGDGAWVLNDILRRGGMLETSVVPGDTQMTGFREGRRSLAMEILKESGVRESALLKRIEELADETETL